MRNAVIVLFAFVLLVGQATAGMVMPLGDWSPNLLLPIVIYLGVSHDAQLVRGAAIAFVLGYLLDLFSGSPMGLQTFVLVASFLVARGTGLNLFGRGAFFQIALMFAFSLIAGVAILSLASIFEAQPPPFPLDAVFGTIFSLVAGSIVTAIASPVIFAAMRRIEALATRRRDESAASP
ncbi:MAG: rod shape-determining protein MreD [Sandaracinaceae bacterium]|nr:rod shape-determining protein MreD [Sandaracinaceae bacterium]